jgi:hypothetical protein
MSISNILYKNNFEINAKIFQANESANAVTTSITAAQVFNGIATVDTSGGAVSCQLPTAATLVAALSNVVVGNVIKCLFVANGSNANDITLTTNTGLTLLSAPLVLGNTSRLVYFRFTNISSGTEAVSVY